MLEMSSKVEKVESDVRTLERHPLDELESLKTSVSTLQNSEEEGTESLHSLEAKLMDAITAMQNQLNYLKASLESEGRNPLVSGSSGAREVRQDLPKAKEFKGVRDAKLVETFLWQMERYAESLGLSEDQAKVRTASFFLIMQSYGGVGRMRIWRRAFSPSIRGMTLRKN